MDHRDFRRALRKTETTQAAFARMLHVDSRTTRKWANNEADVPRYVEIILWMMTRYKVTPERIPDYTNPGD